MRPFITTAAAAENCRLLGLRQRVEVKFVARSSNCEFCVLATMLVTMLVTVLALGMHLPRGAHGGPFLQEAAPVVGVLLLRLSCVFISVFVAMLVAMLVATMQCRLNQLVVFVVHCVYSK
jgi:hypothetical protein